ncbi:CAP domain-containing protein [Micromonospora sp. LH3U1]|uniref:CAP domain-containing protein n=1 Tax=Micromonospora sp. LH3U1 TaxID=3018339 RepID=UPI00234B8202|nr:CAP domain-containing protein [Micromonospora sp. LH3U1]WCN82777.1 CAP domain-containing protein [Micromonospora sp. LH3U1]
MYGWSDPMDPNGAPRRAERPTDEPNWLHDRPEPRSAYLFGDEPDQPGDEWHREQPTGPQSNPTGPAGSTDAHTAAWPAHQPDGETGIRGNSHPVENTTGGWHTDADPATTGGWHTDADADPETTEGWHAGAGVTGRTGDGRHRSPRRWRRPLMIGGAAAAATLVVSFGVGALALPGGDQGTGQPTAVDDTFAASAVPTEQPALDTLAAPSPSATPTPAQPSPSPSKVVKPTPTPSRTTAASRRSVERSKAPSTTGGSSGSSGTVSAQAREVVNLVNAERAKAGCKALGIDDKLMTAAQRHSQDQADHQNMSHTGSDGSNSGVRLDRVGYAWRTYGENVAWNQKTPAAVMDAWMNSSGHRANILNCAFTEIGVGIASSNGPYWTQVFAAPR